MSHRALAPAAALPPSPGPVPGSGEGLCHGAGSP